MVVSQGEKIMAKKKFFGSSMPQEVIKKSYPKNRGAMKTGMYVDTQEGIDKEFGKSVSQMKKGMRK